MALRVMNQYSELVPDDWFWEYQQEDTSSERREEIANEVFRIIRSINTYPQVLDNFEHEIKALRMLVNTDVHKVYNYDNNDIGLNNNGLSFLYKFYPNIWKVEKRNCPMSCYDAFFDDGKLNKAIRKMLMYSKDVLDIVAWLRMTGHGYCSNFRPSAARVIYELNTIREGARIIDSSNGYGGRLLGAWSAENVVEYVSMDPNTETYNNTLNLIDYLNTNYNNGTRLETYCIGSEDFTKERFPQYVGYFDLYFTSPPYFDCEQYSKEETQSYIKFDSYTRWVKGFYRPTINNMIDMLKPSGVGAINIFEKVPNIKEITKLIFAERGFYLYKIDNFLLRTMPGGVGDKENGGYTRRDTSLGTNSEPIWYFKHYESLLNEGLITEEQYKVFKDRDKK